MSLGLKRERWVEAVETPQATPTEVLLGRDGEAPPTAFKELAAHISVHWYPTGAKKGDRCFCGEHTKA